MTHEFFRRQFVITVYPRPHRGAYITTKCWICNQNIVHNQYRKDLQFMRITHIGCASRYMKTRKKYPEYGRMNDHIQYRDGKHRYAKQNTLSPLQ